jgi:DNA-binding transcriptional LysR family regulator
LIDKLDFLLALAREEHFGRAAEACGVTQPTLSAGVKQLEETLGVLLVNRGSRFQSFTAEGERVLDWARRIVGDTRAMRQELNSIRNGLNGRLRIAAIPTTLGMVASLTTPFRMRHPNVQFTIWSRTSVEVLTELENLEIDAGITYLDNEPLGKVNTIPLYRERYRLLTSADAPLGQRDSVTWNEVAEVPLCLLKLAETLGLTETLRSIPITDPDEVHTIGLVVPEREPMTPLTAALVAEAQRVAPTLDN